MPKNTIKNISNAFSTGGGGTNFEQQIQAMFLLSLLIEGFCPAMNEQTKQVCFQAKHLGYDTDDLVILTHRRHPEQSEGKLLCQVKHSITISEKNKTFNEVISAAWSDFNKEGFDKGKDKIALATARIAIKSQQALRYLHATAVGSIDEEHFINNVTLAEFSNSDNRTILNTMKNCITAVNSKEPTQKQLWQFCKVFILLLFDLDCYESVNRALSSSLIKCKSTADPSLVWSKIVEFASFYNQTAACINRDTIDESLLEYFSDRTDFKLPSLPVFEIDPFIPDVALVGAWNENNAYDRKIIETITGQEYGKFQSKARNLISHNTKYLQLLNGNWKVLHKEALLSQCKNQLFDDCLNRLIRAAQTVFTQTSKRVIDGAQYLSVSEGEFDNSNEIRKSLAISLCWLKKELHNLPNCNHVKFDNSCSLLVRTLLQDGEWITRGSLRDCLQYFAELSPNDFLQMIERNIIEQPQKVLSLFPRNNIGFIGQPNNIAVLLWALETLAWSPDYLVPAIGDLGLLEALTYEKTNWVNTPLNSIVSILLPWHPQTISDFEKRKNALHCLKNDDSEVYWEVITGLLPNKTSISPENPRPKYLPIIIPTEIVVTNEEIYDQYFYYLKMAVDFAKDDIEKLSDLSDQIEYMNEETLLEYLKYIDKNSLSAKEKERFIIWLNLGNHLSSLELKEGTVIFKQVEKIRLILKRIEPQNICYKYQELYLGNRLLSEQGEYISDWEKLEHEKTLAVKEIFNHFGISEAETFGKAVSNVYDVANKLGYSVSNDEMSTIINAYHLGKLSAEFYYPCITAFTHVNGPSQLLETSLGKMKTKFILETLSRIPFSMELLTVVNRLLPEESAYWEKAIMPFSIRGEDQKQLSFIVKKLIECKRYVTAVNTVGHSEFEGLLDKNQVYNLLKLAGTEESSSSEVLENYSVQKLVGWLQEQDGISLEQLSDIEFIYLPVMDSYSEIQPRALYTRLSMEPEYFCSMLELYYKRHSDEKRKNRLNKGLEDRLFRILFQFKVTPGINYDGDFSDKQFQEWIEYVKTWSTENDRYTVAMHTVGSGLSYSKLDNDKMPYTVIIDELNKADNDDIRRGYYLGVVNQRGVHWVDPEEKPELELAADYNKRANFIESKGYSRYATTLREIANHYRKEAEENILSAQEE